MQNFTLAEYSTQDIALLIQKAGGYRDKLWELVTIATLSNAEQEAFAEALSEHYRPKRGDKFRRRVEKYNSQFAAGVDGFLKAVKDNKRLQKVKPSRSYKRAGKVSSVNGAKEEYEHVAAAPLKTEHFLRLLARGKCRSKEGIYLTIFVDRLHEHSINSWLGVIAETKTAATFTNSLRAVNGYMAAFPEGLKAYLA